MRPPGEARGSGGANARAVAVHLALGDDRRDLQQRLGVAERERPEGVAAEPDHLAVAEREDGGRARHFRSGAPALRAC